MAENSAKYSVVITSNTSKLDELKSFLTAMCGVEDLSHKTCPICKKVFASPANRDRHVKRMHQTNISHSTQKNRQNREKNEENIQPDTTINEILDLIKNQEKGLDSIDKPKVKQRPQRSTRSTICELDLDSDSDMIHLVPESISGLPSLSLPSLSFCEFAILRYGTLGIKRETKTS